MPFLVPAVAPHPDHDRSDSAPNGLVRLVISCFAADCSTGDMRVRLVTQTGAVVAQGAVRCTGSDEVHNLPLRQAQPLKAVRVRVLFSCGEEEMEGWGPGLVWLRAEEPAATTGGAKSATKRTGERASKRAVRHTASTPTSETPDAVGTDEPDEATPKTTRPDAAQRREPEPQPSVSERIGRKLDAFPDRVDIRDWPYQPSLAALPPQVMNCEHVPAILDQGTEGACTGFALAAVVNFLLRRQKSKHKVSPYMLYYLARRYDEWPGDQYEGSSARGAMKAWVRHGVCVDTSWLQHEGISCLSKRLKSGRTVAEEGQDFPGGAFYRVQHDQVRDVHAAIAETGIVYCTLMVHEGWAAPTALAGADTPLVADPSGKSKQRRRLPVIRRTGRATDGHAVALVGYTEAGFIVQNSWNTDWGAFGFALLPYEDFLLHSTDVWVMQIGVPVRADLWTNAGAADTSAGLQRAENVVPLDAIRPHVIDVGNNGELSNVGDYWTTDDDIERLFAEEIPARTNKWRRRRILLYLHGGLNNERSAARRVVAFRQVMLDNEIYPLHVMWESGALETLNGMLRDLRTDVDDRARGPADWLRRLRNNVVEAKDWSIELTLARPGGAVWREMKENARLASEHPDGRGGMQILCDRAAAALTKLGAATRDSIELHVVAHSAGSLLFAHALPLLLRTGIPIRSVQLMAPAITMRQFEAQVLPHVRAGQCPRPTLYVLSDAGERDDTVGPYGKSLLFLVSNAFEGRRDTPLLGMERFVSDAGEMGARYTQSGPSMLFRQWVDGRPSLVLAGDERYGAPSLSRSDTHGGFDNDRDTMNSVLARIIGKAPDPEFTVRDLRY